MSLKLYGHLMSPAVRSTILTVTALGLKDRLKIIKVNPLAGDHLKPEFIAKNPCHTIPVLEDGDFVLWDSHAINTYLVNKYSENNALYPKDPQKRALVDCMAHFDTGYLFARGLQVIKALFRRDKPADLEKLKEGILEVYDLLEIILEKRTFVAGNQITIADISIVTTLSTNEICVPLDTKKYPKIAAWYEKMKVLPYYSTNEKGIKILRELYNQLTSTL